MIRVYSGGMHQIKTHQYRITGPVREVNMTQPGEALPDECITEVLMPLVEGKAE
ncbi:MAG: hypothetical protein JXJ20_11895 [Anaerolineae bacterium]|nr:hypothetical protein [Anaerolineae bacterium]